ncbi:MAG: hypothetical protein VBE63_14300 [Lamprobacter sp.]|uniref:lipopolysaccharide biosynthesis protein n=1 Tax=Lamprobacter sp. TaxID=3100796 RepID=UPI002B261A03|nr:hypothetical protein [Lamprobacter sp.]MEA3641095.1 hypothetical protein [Lamprobacter sp.]
MRQRLLRGFGAQGISQAVQIFIRLAEVPLFLHFWGAQGYGEWLMVAAIPAYLTIADGGFAGAASRDMSMRSAAGDQSGALAVYQSIWLLLLGVSSLLVVAAYLALEALPLAQWLGFQFIDQASIKVVLLLLVAHVLVGFQGGLINGGFWCSGRYPLGMLLAAFTAFIEFGALALTIALGGGPIAAAAAFLGGRVAGTFLTWFVLRFATPWLHYGWRRASVGEIRRLTTPAFASLAFPLGNAMNIQGMRLIVGVVLGPAAVAVFSATRTLARLAMQPRAVINKLMQPEMAFAYGRGNISQFQFLFKRSCQAAFWSAATASLALAVVGSYLFGAWTSDQFSLNWLLFAALLTGSVVDGVWYAALMVMYATNRHQAAAMYYVIVYGLAAFILAWLTATITGIAGVGLALLISDVAMAIYIVPKATSLANISLKEWLNNLVTPPTWLLTVAAKHFFNQKISFPPS